MAITKNKVHAKKEREKRVAKKMLRRREAMRAFRKEEAAKEAALEKEYFERRNDPTLTQEKRSELLGKVPVKSVKNLTSEEVKERDELIVEKLKKNIQILEELERQYMAEQKAREDTNKALEAEGAVTPQEKLELLRKKMEDKMKDSPNEILITN